MATPEFARLVGEIREIFGAVEHGTEAGVGIATIDQQQSLLVP